MNFRPTVLVVEDEALKRMDIVQCLEEAGCEVLEAADAVQAIPILECRPDIHLVFTDIDMPGSMDGLKLASCVTAGRQFRLLLPQVTSRSTRASFHWGAGSSVSRTTVRQSLTL